MKGSPSNDEEAKFLLVHARPFLLTYDPNALNPWGLAITTIRMPSLDGVCEVVGQVGYPDNEWTGRWHDELTTVYSLIHSL